MFSLFHKWHPKLDTETVEWIIDTYYFWKKVEFEKSPKEVLVSQEEDITKAIESFKADDSCSIVDEKNSVEESLFALSQLKEHPLSLEFENLGGKAVWAPLVEVGLVYGGFGSELTNNALIITGSGCCKKAYKGSVLSQVEMSYVLAVHTLVQGFNPDEVYKGIKKEAKGTFKHAYLDISKKYLKEFQKVS